jgi:hypothetical protein
MPLTLGLFLVIRTANNRLFHRIISLAIRRTQRGGTPTTLLQISITSPPHYILFDMLQ